MHVELGRLGGVIRQGIFVGGLMVLSLIVIALVVARLAGVHYVTYLLEAHFRFANFTLMLYLLAAYILLWWYEYWINRALGEQFLNVFRPKPVPNHEQPKTFSDQFWYLLMWLRGKEGSEWQGPVVYQLKKVAACKRRVQLHSGSHFAALPSASSEAPPPFYSRKELIQRAPIPKRRRRSSATDQSLFRVTKHRIHGSLIDWLVLFRVLAPAGGSDGE